MGGLCFLRPHPSGLIYKEEYKRQVREENKKGKRLAKAELTYGRAFLRYMAGEFRGQGTHTQFSYDKYLRIKPLSERDLKNIQEGKETIIDRTRRLFYVCCTRALMDLVVHQICKHM